MDYSIKNQALEFICEICLNKHIGAEVSNSEDYNEELHCLNCLSLNIQKEAKCLYKGKPSCYVCANTSNSVTLKKSIVNSKTLHPNYNSSRGTKPKFGNEMHKLSKEFNLIEKTTNENNDLSLIQNSDDYNCRESCINKNELILISPNYSSANLNTSISTPFYSYNSKSLIQLV